MKIVKFNKSPDPVRYRTWLLMQETVGEADIKWLSAFNISIRVDAPTQEFDSFGGKTHKIYGKPLYTIETTTDKQRDMLVLKYGNTVALLAEEVVLPGSMSECTLSGITW